MKVSGWSKVDHLSLFMFGATLVLTGCQSMEIIDFIDKMTPYISGRFIDVF
jgi:hypothetical protein